MSDDDDCFDGDPHTVLDSSHDALTSVRELGGRPFRLVYDDGEGPRYNAEDPVIVLMAGAAASSDFWKPVVDRLQHLDVISYDRPGLGGTIWPGHYPQLDEEIASLTELVGLIHRHWDTRQPRKVILVAHSMAAFHAEAFARIHPEAVAGVVFVDPSVEWPTHPPCRHNIALPNAVYKIMDSAAGPVGRCAFAIGVMAQTMRSGSVVWHQFQNHRLHRVYGSPDAMAMAVAEWIGYDQQAWDLMAVRSDHAWPDVPTVLLSAVYSGQEQELKRHERLAPMLGARLVVVENSHHLMMLDRPEVISDAIQSALA
ncbi:alpha/beta hydrolase [Cutibacterium sp. WCA-380-WT-3A]|uniref:Alpha/beta hydrolase n=1 Tax=Cutibacterium porci TaxID=2605781 RepID=A0A7K0J9D5_9ACTN|nr:alpha/beta hydrolase [Cutibacterium porci]MSS46581.1 alpha/beta hydrolase [Cutibacterium porci]